MYALRIFAISVLLLIFTSCATTKVPVNEKNIPSVAGVSIKIKAPIGIFWNYADAVFFVQIDSNGEPSKDNFIRSSFSKDGRVYLLNALPGEYAIVGTFFYNYGSFTSYLSKSSIEKTKFKVSEGSFTFIGELVIDTSSGLDGADTMQIVYSNLISPGGVGAGIFSGDHHYKGEIIEFINNIDLNKKFIEKAKKDLEGGGWDSILR
jgi:hypothetical protein